MPNFIEIGGVTRKPLVDLTRNDPHVKMADAMEIVFDGDLVETEFNKILLDYLDMQGRLCSDEDASDDDDSDRTHPKTLSWATRPLCFLRCLTSSISNMHPNRLEYIYLYITTI